MRKQTNRHTHIHTYAHHIMHSYEAAFKWVYVLSESAVCNPHEMNYFTCAYLSSMLTWIAHACFIFEEPSCKFALRIFLVLSNIGSFAHHWNEQQLKSLNFHSVSTKKATIKEKQSKPVRIICCYLSLSLCLCGSNELLFISWLMEGYFIPLHIFTTLMEFRYSCCFESDFALKLIFCKG